MTPEQQDTALSLFAGSDSLKKVAKAVGAGSKRLRSCWVKEFGEELVQARGERIRLAACGERRAQDETLQVKRQKALRAFSTIESGNQIAIRLKVSRKSLREWWLAEYGQKTVDERSTKMLASGSLLHEGDKKTSEVYKSAIDAFTGSDSSLEIAKFLGVSPSVLRRWWVKEYGKEEVRERGARTKHGGRSRLQREDLAHARGLGLKAFHTEEAAKSVAKRVGVSYPVLRRWWVEEFGEEVLQERGKSLQSKRSAETGRSRRGETRILSLMVETCENCAFEFEASRVSLAKVSRKLCSSCKNEKKDPASCPVCQRICEGQKGLASHFRHRREAGDAIHLAWKTQEKEAKWCAQEEQEDYVTCQECGFRGETLATHLKSHGLDAAAYLKKHSTALIRSRALTERRVQAIAASWKTLPRKGAKKTITCSVCGDKHQASMFLVPSTHETRCPCCIVANQLFQLDARENAGLKCLDWAACALCGDRVKDMKEHIRQEHAEVSESRVAFRRSILKKPEDAPRPPSVKLNLTVFDLVPFVDEEGRVMVLKAAKGLNCAFPTVRGYCRELGIGTRNKLAFQKTVLDLVSKILGNASYEWEYTNERIRNPKTNFLLRYDGYFSSVHLIVEVHGIQHEKFIPVWHKTQEVFEENKALDIFKKNRALEEGYKFFAIYQSDPDRLNEDRLKRRILDLGVPVPGSSGLPHPKRNSPP